MSLALALPIYEEELYQALMEARAIAIAQTTPNDEVVMRAVCSKFAQATNNFVTQAQVVVASGTVAVAGGNTAGPVLSVNPAPITGTLV